ncbi:hypothetical protein BDW66DRAFT_125550 [Aspergillus desertorum]
MYIHIYPLTINLYHHQKTTGGDLRMPITKCIWSRFATACEAAIIIALLGISICARPDFGRFLPAPNC